MLNQPFQKFETLSLGLSIAFGKRKVIRSPSFSMENEFLRSNKLLKVLFDRIPVDLKNIGHKRYGYPPVFFGKI
jgi:hypothetical protein